MSPRAHRRGLTAVSQQDRDQWDDHSLIEEARSGGAAAFEALYRRHRCYVLRVAARFGIEGADAFDILQETFLYLVRKLPAFELRAKLTTFLYPTVKHLCLKKKARESRYAPLDGDGGAEGAGLDLPAPRDEEGERRAVAEILAVLPEGQREVLMLRFADEMTLDEIAAALALPLGTVKSRLHNALRALRAGKA